MSTDRPGGRLALVGGKLDVDSPWSQARSVARCNRPAGVSGGGVLEVRSRLIAEAACPRHMGGLCHGGVTEGWPAVSRSAARTAGLHDTQQAGRQAGLVAIVTRGCGGSCRGRTAVL